MIRRVGYWLRVVTAPTALAFLLLGLSFLCDLIWCSLILLITPGHFFVVPSCLVIPWASMGFALLYGALRVFRTHPVASREYHDWLKSAPWKPGSPLPFAPVHLAPQDIVILAAVGLLPKLSAMAPGDWHSGWSRSFPHPLPVFYLFFISYFLSVACTLFATGQRRFAYLLVFGAASLAQLWRHPFAAVVVEIVFYALAYAGIQKALKAFPWKNSLALLNVRTQADLEELFNPLLKRYSELGWPYWGLSPTETKPMIQKEDGLLIGATAGWVIYAALNLFVQTGEAVPEELKSPCVFFASLGSMAFTAIRIAMYAAGRFPPLSLAGRLLTGHLIIPRYDRILAAPILAMAAGGFTLWSLFRLGIPPHVSLGIATAIYLAILLNGGPTIARWNLTGGYRLVRMRTSSVYAADSAKGSRRQ